MKKILAIIIAVFSIIIVNATPVLEIEHQTYQPQETVFATIATQGSFLEELQKEDITFFEGSKQVFFNHNLYNYDGTYYLDVIFTREGTFTIKTPEILFTLAGEVGSRTLEKTIEVYYNNYDNQTQTYSDILSIKPGIIYTIGNTSQLNLFNRGTNALTVEIDDITTTIAGLQAQTINLNLNQPLTFVTIATYKTFSIPIIYLGSTEQNTTDQENNQTIKETKLFINKQKIEIFTQPNKTTTQTIAIENTGENEITNIKILTEISATTLEYPETISPKSIETLTITVNSEYQSFINDTIIINYKEGEKEYNQTIPILIYITPENQNQLPDPIEGTTCSELKGELCNGQCDGNSEFTTEGYCCIGKCVDSTFTSPDSSEDTSYGWIIGIGIFVVIIIIGYLIYRKYHKTKPDTPEKKLDTSKKQYENRLQGIVKDTPVKDKVIRH